MENPFLTGERIYLRPVEASDATADYVSWLNDAITTRFMESGYFPNTLDSVAEYIASHSGLRDCLFLAIVLRDGDRHVGNVKLEPIDWVHRSAEFGIMIGDPAARGHGIGTEATVLVLRHAFDRLNLHRVALGVVADNLPAIRSYEKVGFREEGSFRQAILREGRFLDLKRMAILAPDFRKRHGRVGNAR